MFFSQDNKASESAFSGYNQNGYGTTLGLDCLGSNGLSLGFGFAYSYNRLNWKNALAASSFNTYSLDLSSAWDNNRSLSIDAAFSYAYNSGSARRDVRIDDAVGSLHRAIDHDVSDNTLTGSAGVFWYKTLLSDRRGTLNIGPFAEFLYTAVLQSSYQESGGGSLDLVIESKNSDVFKPQAGVALEKTQAGPIELGRLGRP